MNRWYLHGFSSIAYGFLVYGLIMMLAPVMLLLPVNTNTKIYLFDGVIGIGIVLGFVVLPFWKPTFLKPAWLRRLETQYPPDAIEMFKYEWKKMNRDEWAGKIGTEDGMKELVVQITDKYGEYDPECKKFVQTITVTELSRLD